MQGFSEGDRVRVDTPDETEPDHQTYLGEHGRVFAALSDEADSLTADEQDALLYRVVFDSGETADFRRRDWRPPIENSSQA